MKKFTLIFTVLAILGLHSFVSCEQQTDGGSVTGAFEVSVKNSKVGSGKGQQFVNVKCSGDWTLALTSEQGDIDWARLSVNSGTGNKSNVVLSYDVNPTESNRTLKVILDNGSKWVECQMTQLATGQHPDDDPDSIRMMIRTLAETMAPVVAARAMSTLPRQAGSSFLRWTIRILDIIPTASR